MHLCRFSDVCTVCEAPCFTFDTLIISSDLLTNSNIVFQEETRPCQSTLKWCENRCCTSVKSYFVPTNRECWCIVAQSNCPLQLSELKWCHSVFLAPHHWILCHQQLSQFEFKTHQSAWFCPAYQFSTFYHFFLVGGHCNGLQSTNFTCENSLLFIVIVAFPF